MRISTVVATLWLAFGAVPALAQAGDGLGCMDRDYDAPDQAALDNYLDTFDLMSPTFTADSMALVGLLSERIEACTTEQGWSEAQGDQAFLYKFGSLMRDAQGLRNPRVVELDRRIREDIPSAERDRLYAIMRETLFGDLTGAPTREPTLEEIAFIDAILKSPAVNATDDEAEVLGGYMSARMVVEDALANFARLQ